MNKTILITGCSSGIGYDAATHLKKIGWRVFATCRKEDDCNRLKREGLEAFLLDYEKSCTIEKVIEEIAHINGNRLDALFNNGAHAIPGAVEDLTRDALRNIFEVNVFGHVELINKSLPLLRNSPDGRVINCSSVLGFVALPYRGAYNATKFAIEAITDTLRREPTGKIIKFILLEPGPIRTKIRENSIPHFERWIDWKHSNLVEFYKKDLLHRLYQQNDKLDFFELEPKDVTKKLVAALSSRKPKERYYVTYPTHAANIINRILSTRLQDLLYK
jgi:NAD(P)-dependent dehydrogenase (short-subunit alcohol dehydrogenase family)